MDVRILTVIFILLACGTASGQDHLEHRRTLFADVGYARTWDDEGFLGSGVSLSASAGVRITPRLTIAGFVERIPYYRDVEYLTFDGRVWFAGLEAGLHSTRRRVRPFLTAGAGIMHDQRTWVQKQIIGFGRERVEDRTRLHYTLAMMTTSGGIEARAAERLWFRAGVRLHGLLDTGDDLAPHIIVQTFGGAALYW